MSSLLYMLLIHLRCRVKGLSKNNNSKRDLSTNSSSQREATSPPPSLQQSAQVAPQVSDYVQDNRLTENGRRPPLDPGRHLQYGERETLSNHSIEYSFSGREDSRVTSTASDKDRQSHVDISDAGVHDLHGADLQEVERVQVVLPARRKGGREEKSERYANRDDQVKADGVPRRQSDQVSSATAHSRMDTELDSVQFNHEGHINAILEV